MSEVRVVVGRAAWPSCASVIREALDAIADVEGIEIDEAADRATVRLQHGSNPSQQTVARMLETVPREPGHTYRVQPVSWLAGEGAAA